MQLYLIRNGETVGNLQSQLQGRTQGELSSNGVVQAELTGRLLNKYTIEKVYCSPLSRASDTFRYSNLALEPVIADEVGERNFGALTGKTYFDMIDLPPDYRPEGGEKFENLIDMRARAAGFLERVISENSLESVVAAFSHHEFIASCVAYVLGMPLENMRRLQIPNASITLLEYDKPKDRDYRWLCRTVGSDSHLGELRQRRRVY